ncbi:MAG TPA: acyltransferase, partial [Polyangiaceae bacterium]|nr:acyltransferase [Polyangiaceae bacterium]
MQKNAAAHAALHIPSLDGIRAFSFLIVFLSHAGLSGIVPGHFGLTLFFFLSGYLITTLMRVEFDTTSNVSFKQFYLRRVLRILPPFYLVLIAATLLSLSGFLGGEVTWRGFGFQAAHLTNYYIIGHGWWTGLAPGTWVYWSLAVEEHFYFVFPLLYLWLRRKGLSGRGQALTLLSICALLLIWRIVLVYGLDAPKDRTYVATDT